MSETATWQKLSLESRDGEPSTFRPAAVDNDTLVTVMLQMSGEPVAQSQAEAAQEGRTLSPTTRAQLRGQLRSEQEPVRRAVEALHGQVVATTQDAFNGVKVRVSRASLEKVAELPGVEAVLPVPTVERGNETSVPFLGVPEKVWQDLGLTGKDVSIGIIDTGIDYTHADFGGPGTAEAYQADNPTVVEPGTFPTAKVVGGWDFVGDDYNAGARPGDPALVPHPDGDPLDCQGHGTHVAGTAAGSGVLADGTTYTGPYDSSTYDHDFTVAPGVAPQASLYALKIFGCTGSTDMTVEAVNWAVAHDLDVINLSLGSAFSSLGQADVEAIDNAARAGVIPVLAAGNAGDVPYIVDSPGTADRGISVAAVDAVESFPGATVTAGTTSVQLQISNAVTVSQPISGKLVALQDDPSTTDVNESLGCRPEDYSGVAPGDVVLTYRGSCPRVDRAKLGQAAGAAAVVLVNDAPGLPPVEGPVASVTIPFLGATPEQGNQLAALNGQQVSLTAAGPIPNPNFRGPASFTSSGPALAGDTAKPDVAAPGVSIVSAGARTGAGSVTMSGTSMATPLVAGVAALVRQARPRESVETVKAAIVNTANPGATKGYSTVRLGAGLVDPGAAVRTPVVAVGDVGTASLSFGFLESQGPTSRSKTVTLRNTGKKTARFAVAVDQSSQPPGGASVSVSPKTVSVRAGAEATVRVTVTVTPARDLPSGGFQAASGTVQLIPTAGDGGVTTLRVPYLLVPRAVSDVQTQPDVVRLGAGRAATFRTRNGSPVAGTADVYAWGVSDPKGDDVVRGGLAPDIRAVGVRAFPDQGMGEFAVSTYTRLGSASVAEYDVLVDVDESGAPDFAVIGIDLGRVTTGQVSGTFASVVYDLNSGRAISAYVARGGLNSSTVLLPFAFADMGINAANPEFLYDVNTYSLIQPGADEVDGRAPFNAFTQPLQTGQHLELAGRSSISWTATVDREQLKKTPTKGWMVVSMQNRNGPDQAQLVPLR
ncbi:MAG: S8 family serine peptidase [Actinomycetes bacterium]